MIAAVTHEAAFDPRLVAADPAAERWMLEATLRLRREIAWRWHERELGGSSALPWPDGDPVIDALDLRRYGHAKRAFLATDVAARYLGDRIAAAAADDPEPGWRIRDLVLEPAAALALALGVLARADAASGAVFGAALGDVRRVEPTLALVQRLTDDPGDVLPLVSAAHPVWRFGLLVPAGAHAGSVAWDAAYGTPPLVAARLLDPDATWPEATRVAVPPRRVAFAADRVDLASRPGSSGAPLADRLRTPPARLRVLPVEGRPGPAAEAAVLEVARAADRRVVLVAPEALGAGGDVPALLTRAWLDDADLLLDDELAAPGQPSALVAALASSTGIPATVFLRAGRTAVEAIPEGVRLPGLTVPPLGYAGRLERWSERLGDRAGELGDALAECARRFRFEADRIDAVAAGLVGRPGELRGQDLLDACRAAAGVDLGGLAQPVEPRFGADEIVLPPEQRRQFREIEDAMRSLAEVHHQWGTGRAWNEAGLAVLFAGPSGTGKTMAAEVLAAALGIPMYRVNLAQVVDKYIGETEKNLERIFAAADSSDCVLFFDEADALFGKRTDVRDSHDRYANVEVAYLLERMERFKGLAILATNRRGDLDDAFLRRLRYVVEFRAPDVAERRSIWERAIPPAVDASELDFGFLARQFQLTGGNIRSAVLNACLQAAAEGRAARAGGRGNDVPDRPTLRMAHVLVAVQREHDKLERTTGVGQFGPYAGAVEALLDG